MMYSLDEIGLIPATISDIKSRKEVNPFVIDETSKEEKLPVFVSPMTCIVNANNIQKYSDNKFIPILPVTPKNFWKRGEYKDEFNLPRYWTGWEACTLDEFKKYFIQDTIPESEDLTGILPYYILLDVANGHMKQLFDLVKQAKDEYGSAMKIMIGNIANPETYLECVDAGVDYVRVGIGGGSGCTTSVQTGIHASMSWILDWIPAIKEAHKLNGRTDIPKVIADGGITTISRAIKCLALGADYVMMGKAFAECNDINGKKVKKNHYYGQSSPQGQLDRFGEVKSNPEGTDLWVPCTTNLAEFSTKFEAALRSAMSYTNARTLDEFIGKVRYDFMSPDEYRAYNK